MNRLFLFIAFSLASLLVCAQKLSPTDKLALLQGTVTNFSGKALVNEIIILVNEKTKSEIKVTTGKGGKFEVLAPVGVTYVLRYKSFTTDMDYSKMDVPNEKDATFEVLIKIDPPKEITLSNVYFDTGKSTLKTNSNKALNDLVEVLQAKKTMEIEIEGHTDNAGSAEDNLKLSQARADEVKKYLVKKGVEGGRVTAKGYGHTRPIADNSTEQGRSKNRRTGLKVVKE